MFRKSAFLLLLIPVLLAGCADLTDGNMSYDPDPQDGTVQLANPDEALYVVVNVSLDGITGSIIAAWTDDPENTYTILVSDACIQGKYAEIRLSPNRENLLYARMMDGQADLVLYNIDSGSSTVLFENIKSNESEFINNDSILFSDDGVLKVYKISDGTAQVLVPRWDSRCNHWPQISPNLDKVIYKDQNPNVTDEAHHAWSSVVLGQSSDNCNEISVYTGDDYPVGLYDSFFYNWLDNSNVIFKNKPGITNCIFGINVDDSSSVLSASIASGGNEVRLEKILVSPDKETLLIYGNYGVYTLDLVNQGLSSGAVAVEELYYEDYQLFKTLFAAFGSQSKSMVVGTSNWIGVYNVDSLEKTNVSLGYMLGDRGILYGLHCR